MPLIARLKVKVGIPKFPELTVIWGIWLLEVSRIPSLDNVVVTLATTWPVLKILN